MMINQNIKSKGAHMQDNSAIRLSKYCNYSFIKKNTFIQRSVKCLPTAYMQVSLQEEDILMGRLARN